MKTRLLVPALLIASAAMAQQTQKIEADTIKKIQNIEGIVVSRLRAKDNPSNTTVTKEVLGFKNFGQDMPTLLEFTPSVVTTSDAGAGVGYSGLRIRGVDASRINVTINVSRYITSYITSYVSK